ncbi:MAG: TIGR02281 family clan AA aspartic protease [Hyphomicrobiaceae bacterium]
MRETCDKIAVRELGRAVSKAGFRRQAAKLHLSFSDRCGGHPPSLRAAANDLLTISDYGQAVYVTTKLIELEPFRDNGYYLRGLAYYRGYQFEPAIDDFITAIELFADKSKISSAGYLKLSKSYEQLDQFCDAIGPIEAWVAIAPNRHDTSRTRAMVNSLRERGQCSAKATERERFRIRRRGHTIRLRAKINGVSGRFIIDTGATFVALKRSFAEKAKVTINESTSIRLSTANGIVMAKRGRADQIQLRSLSAENIPIVVQSDKSGTYGKGIHGLLGMSFLSRFNIRIDRRYISLRSR